MNGDAIAAVVAELLRQAGELGIELDQDAIDLARDVLAALLARRAIKVTTTADIIITEHK